jgi:NAD(P)H-dependent flavin oxidoreductase YrpB (nitropropane dioxygenase family)
VALRTQLSRDLGLELPLFAFTYEPAVAAAVSREGGLGVLGALRFTPEELDEALAFVAKESGGRPFGVNVVTPASSQRVDVAPEDLAAKLESMIPDEHRRFVEDVLDEFGVPPLPEDGEPVRGVLGWTPQTGAPQVEVALQHRPALFSSALGPPPAEAIDASHDLGIPVAALVGKVEQAQKQREAGVDIVVAQGTEAAGHTGEVATMVLVPQVVDALAPAPVLAAGGIADGRSMAAALALGAQGVWTGSVWLLTQEHALAPQTQQLLLDAGPRDTLRTRTLTGKPARLVRTPWIDRWEDPGTPDPLGMPLQFLLTSDANSRFRYHGRYDLAGSPAGQVVGRLDSVRPVAEVVAELRAGAEEAIASLRQVAAEEAGI